MLFAETSYELTTEADATMTSMQASTKQDVTLIKI
jgi:hypothetical protein